MGDPTAPLGGNSFLAHAFASWDPLRDYSSAIPPAVVPAALLRQAPAEWHDLVRHGVHKAPARSVRLRPGIPARLTGAPHKSLCPYPRNPSPPLPGLVLPLPIPPPAPPHPAAPAFR